MLLDRRIIAAAAILQGIVATTYYLSVPDVGPPFALVGVISGLVVGVFPNDRGAPWTNGTAAGLCGAVVFIVLYLPAGFYHALPYWGTGQFGWVYSQEVRIGVALAVMLRPVYAIEGLVAGALFGYFRRQARDLSGRVARNS